MPIERAELESAGPDGPHLALLMDESGMRVAIPPGASLWVVEDKAKPEKIFPLTLKAVSHKKLSFVMVDDKGALVEYVYQLMGAKPLNKAAHERLRKQARPGVKVQR